MATEEISRSEQEIIICPQEIVDLIIRKSTNWAYVMPGPKTELLRKTYTKLQSESEQMPQELNVVSQSDQQKAYTPRTQKKRISHPTESDFYQGY